MPGLLHGVFFTLLLCVCTSGLTAAPAQTTDSPSSESINEWLLPSTAIGVRVRIVHTKKPVRIGGNGPFEYRIAKGGRSKTVLKAITVRPAPGGISIDGKTYKGALWVRPIAAAHVMSINGRQYRGRFEIIGNKGYVDVIEYVELDQYLYGVLPREVGARWPLEALKAQAVISRTYALANRNANAGSRFDLVNSVHSQVYGGLADEAPETNRAVDATKGEILVDADQKPIQAFFHATCGGHTEKPDTVWSSKVDSSLFASAPDESCSTSPHSSWTMKIAEPTLRARLRRAGISVGEIRDVRIAKTSASGRAQTFLVVGRSGRNHVAGNRFRLAVGPELLRSTRLDRIQKNGTEFHFAGRGWGHGVGMCQWGAKNRAETGHTYRQILAAYYPGAILETP